MKTRILAIVSAIFSVFILSGIIFGALSIMLNLTYQDFQLYSVRDQFLVVATVLFPFIGTF